jgi:hypothetical protein
MMPTFNFIFDKNSLARSLCGGWLQVLCSVLYINTIVSFKKYVYSATDYGGCQNTPSSIEKLLTWVAKKDCLALGCHQFLSGDEVSARSMYHHCVVSAAI